MNLLQRLLCTASPSFYRLAQNVYTLAMRHGQLRSMRSGNPVAADGSPLPWYTYPAIEYLAQFDFSERRVFEFGAGNSSLYWAARARQVVSVESDPGWFERVRAASRPNQTLLLRGQRDAYVGALLEQPDDFDLIVIDGRWRHACAAAALDKLGEGGLVVLDNSDKYSGAAAALREQGLFELDFSGFGPVTNYAWTTSIFVRANNRLQRRYASPRPIAGRNVTVAPEDEDRYVPGAGRQRLRAAGPGFAQHRARGSRGA